MRQELANTLGLVPTKILNDAHRRTCTGQADLGGHVECSGKPLEGGGLVLKPSSPAQMLCDLGQVAYSLRAS